MTEQRHPSRRRPHQTEEAADGRGLARPVGAEEAEHAAFGHGEIESGYGRHRSLSPAVIGLAQLLDLDDVRHGPLLPSGRFSLGQTGGAPPPGATGRRLFFSPLSPPAAPAAAVP